MDGDGAGRGSDRQRPKRTEEDKAVPKQTSQLIVASGRSLVQNPHQATCPAGPPKRCAGAASRFGFRMTLLLAECPHATAGGVWERGHCSVRSCAQYGYSAQCWLIMARSRPFLSSSIIHPGRRPRHGRFSSPCRPLSAHSATRVAVTPLCIPQPALVLRYPPEEPKLHLLSLALDFLPPACWNTTAVPHHHGLTAGSCAIIPSSRILYQTPLAGDR
ncbi:hypothetical protein BU26DRAFT_83111 [Trematosphaeria pertusa]|uniref:Uncharacterized protein n=1 Tax=Trematosphaeria pertusa TaxID=390896 RepID=A0A6A6I304_9PLEO|nr:uncharacterized protein BU26DRAFT_83111 [Trematosphaeria pertusa]KAF2244646.1 hypothetical protein BU26DRAFT_83111 [Trematosphaeria pertusa]